MIAAAAPAKINLALVVGPQRDDGRHELVTVYQRVALAGALKEVRRPRDLAALPPNDLASSPLADELRASGAFRADIAGAGPTVYGLFLHGETARAAERRFAPFGRTWITAPAWYG